MLFFFCLPLHAERAITAAIRDVRQHLPGCYLKTRSCRSYGCRLASTSSQRCIASAVFFGEMLFALLSIAHARLAPSAA
jgi:nitric oxide synthase oxygenase domain/subunit